MSSDVMKFFKGVFIGGTISLISLGFLVGIFIEATKENIETLSLTSYFVGFIVSTLLTLWGAGFWGRWGLFLFFALLPIVLITDFTINPFFPLGVILVATGCYWPNKKGKVNT